MYQHVATNCPCCNGVNISRSPAILSPFMAKKIFNWDIVNKEEKAEENEILEKTRINPNS